MQFPDALIQIFCKTPLPGAVKTRLASAVGNEEACRIHEALAERMIEAAIAAALSPVELWCTPTITHDFFDAFDAPRHLQPAGDLGEKMNTAIADGLQRGARCVVLVGTDCPPIDGAYLRAALSALETADAVLGPAEDGGYGLIGLNRACPEAFTRIPWSTDGVAQLTLERFEASGLQCRVLPSIWDVDDPEDLARWRG